MQNVTIEQLIAQYQATLKAYQTKVNLIQSGQVLQIGDVMVASPPSFPSRVSVRRR